MSVAAALLVSACCGASLQAVSASRTGRRLAAARISETRHWTRFRTYQLFVVTRQSLIFGPALALAGESEIGAERVGGCLDIARRTGRGFVESHALAIDDQ